jgi:hypothetical protein
MAKEDKSKLVTMITEDISKPVRWTTITVSKETHQRLINLGRKNETFDEIIQRLIRFYENHKGGAVAA